MTDKELKNIYLQQVVHQQATDMANRDVTQYIKTNEKSQKLNDAYLEVLKRNDNVEEQYKKEV
jgi:hypothetical protein